MSERKWRPMQTAPKDGTDILLVGWVMHEQPGGPFPEYVVAAWDVEEIGGENGWSTDNGLQPIEFRPAGWLRLPKAPSLPTAGEG